MIVRRLALCIQFCAYDLDQENRIASHRDTEHDHYVPSRTRGRLVRQHECGL